MSKVFVSYNRRSEALARGLAEDIEALGHDVWLDQELTGGQVWWDRILVAVRECEVFVFVLDKESVTSTACQREYGYAADLGKPILPVLAAEGVATSLLPPALSQIQFVDYRNRNREAAFRLARAFAVMPAPKPLPDPLPAPPEVPVSYLGSLSEKIDRAPVLSYEAQSALVIDLKRGLRAPETGDDARALLQGLRKRRDLFAMIADEIDELLGGVKESSSASHVASGAGLLTREISGDGQEPLEKQMKQRPAKRLVSISPSGRLSLWTRLATSICGAALGTIFVAFLAPISGPKLYSTSFLYVYGSLPAAVAGAITGSNRKVIVTALVGAVVGFGIAWAIAANKSLVFPVLDGVIWGGGPGLVLGAILGALRERFTSRLG